MQAVVVGSVRVDIDSDALRRRLLVVAAKAPREMPKLAIRSTPGHQYPGACVVQTDRPSLAVIKFKMVYFNGGGRGGSAGEGHPGDLRPRAPFDDTPE
ncbi:unnamed protein product [Mesocestoides corti]|uniref:Single-stranded DNA-binding protein n=1 Tax=Mesocestoides corti TaxID=53468 RepID=A0A0R3UEQ5_MESCO|nr:unnamed protein product [Mesocestoides corti]